MPTFVCPICRHVLTVKHRKNAPFRPFCSERCKAVDLGKWLDGTYRISEPLNSEDVENLTDSGDNDVITGIET